MRQDAEQSFGENASPDSEDRIREFLARHGGPSPQPSREEITQSGMCGVCGGWVPAALRLVTDGKS